ncbi:CPBP family intramembrane glutamic endopeptidase [Chitinophaga sp. Cy-1792]|uniref:CPBP family intramembrane glutamic endopeptidase n=1 Tax=Chitinophaga sp. Cy-1792 TaxID=2608339 RepID=UPI001423E6F1|nr:CPBP family intramembrane glutamic endopeptidase [Chitinophaga sp. Cy-1792]
MLPNLPLKFLNQLDWNWQGKFLSILWGVLFILCTSFLTRKEAGFEWKVERSSWPAFIIVCLLGIGLQWWDISTDGGIKSIHFNAEKFWYELTMPGLSEELIYRGIILGLLNKIFISRVRILGASVGWGLLIQAVIFGGGHSFYFDDASAIHFALAPALITGAIGLVIGWLRERTGSIVLPIVFHNLFNVFPQALAMIF